MAYLEEGSKDALLKRLARIEGQVRGIARMVEQDTYCVDILNQISAVRSGLDRVGTHLMGDHIRGCVAEALDTDQRDEKIEELTGVVERFLKT